MGKFKQHIQVKNLGPLKEVDLELDKLVVFIGQQASGKSTLAKLIYFFKELDSVFEESYISWELIDSSSNIKAEFINILKRNFTKLFGSTLHLQDDFSAKFQYTSINSIELMLNEKKELVIIFSNDFWAGIETCIAHYKGEKRIDKVYEKWYAVIEDERLIAYVPAGRNIVVAFTKYFQQLLYSNRKQSAKGLTSSPFSGSNEFLILDFMEKVSFYLEDYRGGGFEELAAKYEALTGKSNKFKTQALSKINSILRGEYKNNGDEVLIPENTDQKVFLTDASSGQQEAIRILQDLFLRLIKNENVIRLIEEPEAHLFPTAQKHLIDFFVLFTNVANNQMILTTHSPYILSALNNLLFAKQVAAVAPKATSKLVDPIFQLDVDDFGVYELKDGKINSIIDKEVNLIAENFLDNISEELGNEFDELQRILAKAYHNEK